MKLRDAAAKGLAQQQRGDDIYEVAVISSQPINQEYWSLTKRAPNEVAGQIIHHKEQLDDMIKYVENQLGLDPNGWIKL